jgi:hypothetical protein
MPERKKAEDLVIALSREAYVEAEDFIARRIKLLASRPLDLAALLTATRGVVSRQQAESARLDGSRFGRLRFKMFQASLSGLAQIAAGCARAVTSGGKAARESGGGTGPGAASGPIVSLDDGQRARGAEALRHYVEGLSVGDLAQFREACEDLLAWWDSEKGLSTSLCIQQHGNIATSAGRVAIRAAREKMARETLTPFKAFYQDLSLRYRRLAGAPAPRQAAGPESRPSTPAG